MMIKRILSVWCLGLAIGTARPATVTWDGGGGDFSWQNAANWSGDALPGVNDDAVIALSSNVTITSSASVTIRSLQCSNHLALSAGTFRVRDGSSVVQGQLTTAGNPILSVTGAVTSFTVVGPASADGAGFESVNATLSLPGLTQYSKGPGCVAVFWVANGSNAVLQLPGLTNLIGATCATLNLHALAGGTISLPNLIATGEGSTFFIADGAGSLVDLPLAQRSFGTARVVSFEARNNAVISLPLFTGGTNVTVILRTGGVIPVTQLTELSGFTVVGTNVHFLSLSNLTTGNVTVDGGAVVRATNLVSHGDSPGCSGHLWLATGAGSVLDLSGLGALAGESCGFLNVQANAGGTVVLSNLATITEGTLNFLADGAGSVVDLSALAQSTAANYPVSFEARNSGAILFPQFPGGAMVSVALKSGGVLPVTQLRQLRGFTVSGINVTFPALTNLTTGNVLVEGGSQVALPNVLRHDAASFCGVQNWEVSGAGSLLDLSHLVYLAGTSCGLLEIAATDGGTMILSNLPVATDGLLTFRADGTNSVMNLSALVAAPGTARTVTLDARNAGTILVPLFAGGPAVITILQSGGALPAGQMRQLLGFNVAAMPVDFPALTNLGAGNLTVSGGATVTVPNLTRHAETNGCPANTWLVSGSGSSLSFPLLTNLTGALCGYLNVQAASGGVCQFGSLRDIGDGTLNFLADGTNSLLDLSTLTNVAATTRTVSFEARNAGTIVLPLLLGGPMVVVTIKSGGMLDATQMTLLQGLTVSGTTLVLPGLTNLFAGNLTVSTGGVLRLPSLASHDHGNRCAVNTWLATGPGSVLDLASLTNLSGPTCGSLSWQAQGGGTIVASNVQHITRGGLNFLSDGTNSEINLAALRRSLGTFESVSFEVGNGGKITMPLMTGGPTVGVTLKTNGLMPIAQLTQLNRITAVASAAVFASLTNLDSGTIFVSNAATVAAPNLTAYAQGNSCTVDPWIVTGSNSVLDLPALGILTGGACAWLDAQALAGGRMSLGNLGSIPSGQVKFLASGGGSLIDLHSLSNFLSAADLSQITATNGGTILLPVPGFFSGVTLTFAAGSPGLPQLNLPGTNLVLHGHAWRSYWLEQHDRTEPTNAWTFFRRVPLTNDFEPIAPRAQAHREFRGWEFVADPRLLDLTVMPDAGVIPVLYGPSNQTFEIEATTNLAPATWTPFALVAMTNTFRIFPLEPPATPQRFFRISAP